MNKAKYASLPPDLKAVIDKNSGMETSAWLGKVQQGGDAPGRESAVKLGNSIYTIPAAEAQEFKRKARLVEVEWMQDMDKRGFNGKQLLDTAKSLIAKHGKTAKG
jgi:TRAP-type C4-dicarboxylate transport system substrate-binding protein